MFLTEQRRVLFALLDARVKFMIIGGYAVIFHGYARTTGDVDIWIRPDADNKVKLIQALRVMDFQTGDIEQIAAQDFTAPQAFHIGSAPDRVDFLTKVAGLDFVESDKRKQYLILDDRQIPIIHLNDLIVNKLLTGRTKDAADVEELKKFIQFKNQKDQQK